MQLNLETITPEIALHILSVNTSNRSISPRHVEALARDMREEKFLTNGETIKISTDGKLLDGQHRLTAIVKSGKPVEIYVLRGLDGGVMSTVDAGRKRTASDVMAMEGVKNSVLVASVARILFYIAHGAHDVSAGNVTNSEMMAILEKHEGIIESVSYVGGKKNHLFIPPSILAAAHYIAKFSGGHLHAEEYINSAGLGKQLYAGDAGVCFREYALRIRTRGDRMIQGNLIKIMVKNLEEHMNGVPRYSIKVPAFMQTNLWKLDDLNGTQVSR